jgi:hypothetical protein
MIRTLKKNYGQQKHNFLIFFCNDAEFDDFRIALPELLINNFEKVPKELKF